MTPAAATAPTSTSPATRAMGVPSAISADLLAPPSQAGRALLVAFAGLIAAFILWSYFAVVQEVTQGRGRVIPASKLQIVQNLEGGIVREIHAREGQRVREGDVLLRIDPTLLGSTLGEAREKMMGLSGLVSRLEAEVAGTELTFPDDLARSRPDLVAQQRDLYETRQRELEASLGAFTQQANQRTQELIETQSKIATLSRSLTLAEEELALMRSLESTRAVARSEIIQSEVKTNEFRGSLEAARLSLPRIKSANEEALAKRTEKLNTFRSDALQRLAQARVELASLQESSRSSQDKVDRTTVRAPVAGIVKTVSVTTPGQVVQPGSSLVEIVPVDDTLLIEAQIRPQDIAFLHPGQEAIVKLTAYDFAVYGGLKGRVEQIGIDTITPDKAEPYFPVRVRTDRSYLTYKDQVLPIMPGMVTEVDVLTGSKSIFQYLTKPLTRMRSQALRER